MKRGWMIACLGALLLMGAACSEDDPVQPPEPCPPVDNPIPNLELKDLDGKVYDIRDDHCNQMVLIDFGTTWCRPCGYGIPDVQEMHETYGNKGLRVIAVYYERDLELLREHFAEKEVTFPVLQDDHGYVSYFWDARTIPTYVLISMEGEEIFRMVGYDEARMEMLKAEIKSYLDS
jgi:thiol-disulfide isomerase/thioredoxin